ncbi:MAG: DUF1700 domain-containing protein [Oscillospiraceae bacterium]|nr:DUF1700 domain-containing protein [Oscillospiraceae bacterium]
MTRFEFVNRLNGKLYLLSESERRDIIDEYVGHIALKMQEGKTEAEAIKDFGDIDELARDILAAYHIDSSKIADKTLDIYVKQIVEYISTAAEKLLSFSTPQLARIFVEFIILLVILNVIRFPVQLCVNMFTSLFGWLPSIVFMSIHTIVELLANLMVVAISVMFIYRFINKRIINADSDIPPAAQPQAEKPAEETAARQPEFKKEKRHRIKPALGRISEHTGNSIKTAADRTGFFVKKAADWTGDFVINLAILMIRIFLFVCVWAPCALITIAGIICTVLAVIIYATTGIGFAGICIAGVGCCIIGGAFTLWLTQALTGGKVENEQTV